jgi:peptide subunit release factor 1 (eRF1)
MDASTLAKLYTVDGPFVTIYLDTHGNTEDAAEQLEVRWKNVLRQLADDGVDEGTREALTAARGDHTRGGTRVLVAAHGTVHLAISLPPPPPRDDVSIGPLPKLVPLADVLSLQLPHVVVLADRTGADVLAYTSGPEPEEVESVENNRFPQRKVHAGGWAAKRYDNDVEETWEQSARQVASLVDQVARDIHARVVIASGDERALQLLHEHLPHALLDRFVTVRGGGRHVDGSEDVIAQEVLRVLAETFAADTKAILDKFAEERGQHDRAADGAKATVDALRMAQVETLLLSDARHADQQGWCGPEPVHLALSADELAAMGVDAPRQWLLDELMLRAALGTGANVRFIGGGEQAPRDGVGALLRYAL